MAEKPSGCRRAATRRAGQMMRPGPGRVTRGQRWLARLAFAAALAAVPHDQLVIKRTFDTCAGV